MSAPPFSLRLPAALREVMEAEARKSERSLGEVILDACASRYMGHDAEPAPRPKATRTAKPPVAADPREALAQAEARTGVRSVARLDTSMVPVFTGGKRPAYQKGGQGAGKGRR